MTTPGSFESLIGQLQNYATMQTLIDGYYEGTIEVPKLNIAIPPILQHIATVVGWPATAVDVLEERLDFRGWDDGKKYGLGEVYDDNSLGYESTLNHIDALMYGVSFVAVSSGVVSDGEPPVLVTTESAKNMTGLWDRRKRRLVIAAPRVWDENGKFTKGVLYEENRTTYLARSSELASWTVERVDEHRLGRVPVVRFPNRGRAGRREGKSEITRAVRAYTDMAVRTLLGMEVNREFFSAPQRYVLGAKPDAFVDENGNPIPGWRAIMGHLWGLERDEEWVEEHGGDGMPQVGQFSPAPPGPYLDQVRGLAQLFSAEAAIPPTYLGFATDQAASADAIRALEARLVKRAERRISAWNAGWIEVGQLAVQAQKGGILPPRSDIQALWRDPATPTKAADADRVVKLVGAGLLPADSGVARDMAGISPEDQKRLERDANKTAFMDVLRGGLSGGSTESPQPSGTAADSQVVAGSGQPAQQS